MGFRQNRQFEVISLYLHGRNKMFNQGDVVYATDFPPGAIENLIEKKYIAPFNRKFDKKILNENENGKIKLVIGTMIWKRHDLFQFWCDWFNSLKSELSEIFDIELVAAGSEKNISRELCEKNGVKYVECDNFPLGNKANIRLKLAYDQNPDYVLFLGQDDLVSKSLLQLYHKHMIEGFPVIEVMDLYYFDTKTKKLAYCSGYSRTPHRKGEPVAPARCVHKSVIEFFNCKLWNGRRRISHDSSIHQMLSSSDVERKQIHVKGNHLVLDIKGSGINSFNLKKPNWSEISNSYLKLFFNENQFKKLCDIEE